ncbi:MAG: hypothetical protein IJ048_06255 [Clostridia bacterium]|nr:hypothetical protein [Clostridia bacterium]
MNLQTIRTVAHELDLSETTVRKAVADGRLPSLPLGNRMLVDLDAARSVLRNHSGLNVHQLSEKTGLAVTAIRRGVREGWIPCEKSGKYLRFQLDDVLEAIKKRMEESGGQPQGRPKPEPKAMTRSHNVLRNAERAKK